MTRSYGFFLRDVHFYLRSRRIQKIIAEFAINSIVLRRDPPPHYFRKPRYQSLNSRNEPLRIRNEQHGLILGPWEGEGQCVCGTMVHSVRFHIQWKQRCGGAAPLSGSSSGDVIS